LYSSHKTGANPQSAGAPRLDIIRLSTHAVKRKVSAASVPGAPRAGSWYHSVINDTTYVVVGEASAEWFGEQQALQKRCFLVHSGGEAAAVDPK
jgi:hypothetical protein